MFISLLTFLLLHPPFLSPVIKLYSNVNPFYWLAVLFNFAHHLSLPEVMRRETVLRDHSNLLEIYSSHPLFSFGKYSDPNWQVSRSTELCDIKKPHRHPALNAQPIQKSLIFSFVKFGVFLFGRGTLVAIWGFRAPTMNHNVQLGTFLTCCSPLIFGKCLV